MNRARLTGPLVKSALFVLVTVLATGTLAVSVSNSGVGPGDTYKAWFTDATGLVAGDSVRVAGVAVGQVDSIEIVQHRYAQVEFHVERGRTLPGTTTAAIKYLSMMGQRYVSLDRAAGTGGPALSPGATIPLRRTRPAVDITQLFNGFQPLFRGLSPSDTNKLAASVVQVLQGEGPTVESLVSTIGSLAGTLAAKDTVIGQVIDNLNAVLNTVTSHETGFTDLVDTLDQLVAGLAQDREPIGDAVSGLAALTTSTTALLHEGRAPLKQSIDQLGRVSANLADNAPVVERFLRRTPGKLDALTRLVSYGSWLNLYLCEARVTGVATDDGSRPPTGLALKDQRCLR
ncbi:MCE family protein [Streptomyces sp. LP05-1]|uniref:MCE family protein n=1 Tax=Streptomyces pyxinae TaxID=2970734 RepID=A0ABT2CE85_9ACTN|nr:MCE family protein [Streptomyces sp. LP05-1]MCS0635728.1 MCE family protein [Streptomyces sp. LP05-1]